MKIGTMFGGLLAALMMFGLTACHVDNTGSYYDPYNYYDYYGNYCGSSPYAGCTFTSFGNRISVYDDPYFGMAGFSYGFGYCDYYSYCYNTWTSPTGVWYGMDGYALNSTPERSRDMDGDMAEAENASLNDSATLFAARSGLAEEQALEIVTTLGSFERATQGRGRTSADLDSVSQRLMGKGYREAIGAVVSLKAGDAKPMRQLESDVAQRWGTDAETVREALRGLYE